MEFFEDIGKAMDNAIANGSRDIESAISNVQKYINEKQAKANALHSKIQALERAREFAVKAAGVALHDGITELLRDDIGKQTTQVWKGNKANEFNYSICNYGSTYNALNDYCNACKDYVQAIDSEKSRLISEQNVIRGLLDGAGDWLGTQFDNRKRK